MKIAKCFLLLGFLGACGGGQTSSDPSSIADASSISARSDGKFDVVCQDGTAEVVTSDQIRMDDVCGGEGLLIRSAELRPDGLFDITCRDGMTIVATSQALASEKLCGVITFPTFYDARSKLRWHFGPAALRFSHAGEYCSSLGAWALPTEVEIRVFQTIIKQVVLSLERVPRNSFFRGSDKNSCVYNLEDNDVWYSSDCQQNESLLLIPACVQKTSF